MVPTKPYLLRAIFEWCADQGFTPYIAVAVDGHTRVPREFVRDGQIVLNIGREATHQLQMGNDEITFQARFNGVAFPVNVPVDNVTAIYARENGQGMAFEAISRGPLLPVGDEGADESGAKGPGVDPPNAGGRPKLTRVK